MPLMELKNAAVAAITALSAAAISVTAHAAPSDRGTFETTDHQIETRDTYQVAQAQQDRRSDRAGRGDRRRDGARNRGGGDNRGARNQQRRRDSGARPASGGRARSYHQM